MSRSGVVINPRNSEFGGLVYDMCGAKWRILGVDFVVLLCRLLHGFGWLSVVGWGGPHCRPWVIVVGSGTCAAGMVQVSLCYWGIIAWKTLGRAGGAPFCPVSLARWLSSWLVSL